MPRTELFIAPIADLIDKLTANPRDHGAVNVELLKMQWSREMETLRAQLSVMAANDESTNPWASRARPSFLYVMYAMILWAIPMGLIGAVDPNMAHNFAAGMTAYLAAIPEPMWALFGSGYLGYTAARSWGKGKKFEKWGSRPCWNEHSPHDAIGD